MIANDPRRSFEFFTAPRRSGLAAIASPLDRRQILAMHALRAALAALTVFLAAFAMGRSQVGMPAAGIDTPVGHAVAMMLSSPLRLAAVNFAGGVVFVTLFWVVGRNFNAARDWFEVQSAMTRYLLVVALVNMDFALTILLFAFLYPPLIGVITIVQSAFGVYSLLNMGWVVQGVFDLGNAGLGFLVVFLTMLSAIGLGSLVTVLATGLM